jgi:hypothetical protein
MSTTLNDPPVLDEAFANARLDALIAEHNLPRPQLRYWYDRRADGRPPIFGNALIVVLARADATRWFAMLGLTPKTTHEILEFDDGRWCACWRDIAEIDAWLPGLRLTVKGSEDRWIHSPAVKP